MDLDAVRPEAGLLALADGLLFVGDREHAEQLSVEYDARTAEPTHEQRIQRFDELIDRMEKNV